MVRTHRKSKIALVRGPIVYKANSINNEAIPAIGFAYIAGYLKKYGYDPLIVDAIAEGLNNTWPLKKYPGYYCQGITINEIIKFIPNNSDVIGFSGMFSGEWPILRDLIFTVRESFPKALIVLGGEHATSLSEFCLKDCVAVDVCVRGEGELTFFNLINQYDADGSYTGIYGTGYLDHSGNYLQPPKPNIRKGENKNTPSRIENIDEMPWPYWPDGYLEKFWKNNKSYGVNTGRDMPFLLSRGCPYECTFCSNPIMYGNKYVLRDIDDVVSEIKYYKNKYDITSLTLYDLTAITKKRWIVEFCNRLIDEKIKLFWSLPSGTRSEVLDKEVILLLKKTGCNYLVYAPESGAFSTLKRIKKLVDLNQLTKSVMLAKTHGIITRINLIIGFPEENWKEIFQTIFYGLRMAIKGVDEVPIFLYSGYPGTELYDELILSQEIELNDDFFLSLTSLNSDYLSTNVSNFSNLVNNRLLSFVRFFFIHLNYFISYLLYPKRIYRTIRLLVFRKGVSTTVLENRLNDLINKLVLKHSN